MSQVAATVKKRYLHIGFNFPALIKAQELETVFAYYADDWMRYSATGWVAWTKYDQQTWTNALKPYLGVNDHILILEIVQGQQLAGWAPQWVWDWLFKPRD